MTQEECPFEAWQLIQARKILQWLTEEKAMSLGKQTFLERIEDTLFNIAYKKLGLKPIGKCSVEEFTAHWYKKGKFDPKTLKAFDKILLRDECGKWHCGSFSHINKDGNYKFGCFELKYKYCIPYNDETRYLIGTTDEAPEYYRYWED